MIAVPLEQAHSPPEEDEFVDVPASVRAFWRLSLYSEARTWFQWLNVFVPSDVADAMGVSEDVAVRCCEAAVWQRIIDRTDDFDGREYIYEYRPLPASPRYHPRTTPPERIVGYDEVLSPRGMPIRIRTERNMRRTMSTPGARGRINRREARYRQMQEAVEKKRAKQLERAAKGEPWRKAKYRGRKVDW